MYDTVSKINIYIRPLNRRNKFGKYEYFCKLVRESIERIIFNFIRKLQRKAENVTPPYHRWICNVRLKRFDLLYLYRYIYEPPDTVFRRHT